MTLGQAGDQQILLTGARLVTADGEAADTWIEVVGDRVRAVGQGPAPQRPGARKFDVRDLLVLPGLVDIHHHGGGGGSYSQGAASAGRAAKFHLHHGTTSRVASLVSAPLDVLAHQVEDLAPLVETGVLAGIHLEGPWLSPLRRGAHHAADLARPRPHDVEWLLAAGQGAVRLVTIAPELPGALDAVERIAAAGVAVAVGHTDASYDQTVEALRRGVRLGTHLFNAMRPVHHRDPGPVVALLESDAAVELVADGVHLHPRVVADVADCVGIGRAVLVTDAMAAAGMPDGHYTLGDRRVTVHEGVARGGEGQIAGSTVTLAVALRYAVTVAGMPLRAAVAAATRTPARVLGLKDVGDVAPGSVADLLLLTSDLDVAGVLHRGRWTRHVSRD